MLLPWVSQKAETFGFTVVAVADGAVDSLEHAANEIMGDAMTSTANIRRATFDMTTSGIVM